MPAGAFTGTPERPVKAGIPTADIAAAMYAFSGVPAALVRRGTTGGAAAGRTGTGQIGVGERPGVRDQRGRVAGRERTDALVAGALDALTADEVPARREAAGIACARIRDLAELAEHPQLVARERWRRVGSPVGPLRALLPPLTLPGGAETRLGDVPALGRHTDALLRAVGMTDDEIAALRRDGVAA
ncbi:CoA transferase [Streptomyces bauhiniae]|uniref:CoA transferase n=1 Tax=Streptomyces bauhiniae TaxID=2340725 RepID=UPI0037CFFDE3